MAEREPERITYGEAFRNRHMLRPEQAVLEGVGDPAGAVDQQRRDGWLGSSLPQHTDDILQGLDRQLALAPAPLGDGRRRAGRNAAPGPPRHLGDDAIGLQRQAVSFGAGGEKRGQHDARLARIDGDADDHAAAPTGAKSEPDRGALSVCAHGAGAGARPGLRPSRPSARASRRASSRRAGSW